MELNIREGKRSDLPIIFDLIKELAHYEKALDKVLIKLEDLEKDGFGEHPLYWILVAEINKEIIGMSFYYIRYSTWNGKSLYLEDFVIKEKYRQKGIGSLLFKETIKVAKKINANSMNWQVLNWNIPAINFYKKFNAELKKEWMNGAFTKSQLNKLG